MLHLECAQHPKYKGSQHYLRSKVLEVLPRALPEMIPAGIADLLPFLPAAAERQELLQLLSRVQPCVRQENEGPLGRRPLSRDQCDLRIHIFEEQTEEMGEEMLDGNGESDDMSACSQWLLPHANFRELWDTLYFDTNVKDELLDYIETAMFFADRRVNTNIISWNRVVLLHGPAGTGKTTLCKAIANKFAVRLSNRYRLGQLLEINSHSLFSRWFSESGKLVMKMFAKIRELLEDPETFVVVLIDEVESLSAARKGAIGGSEPSDAIRVVNAMLTQLDSLKAYPNALVCCTSNITGAIDVAFIDRADMKKYIGLPETRGIFEILRSCLLELVEKGLIAMDPGERVEDVTWEHARQGTSDSGKSDDNKRMKMMDDDVSSSGVAQDQHFSSTGSMPNNASQCTRLLKKAAECGAGLSGRALRKLPFRAFAILQSEFSVMPERPMRMVDYLVRLWRAITNEQEDRKKIDSG